MKLRIIFLLTVLSLAHTTVAWPVLRDILNLFARRSRVPQFIYDTDHPWLEENKARLDRMPDAGQALCRLDSDLRTGTAENPPYPADLFQKLAIKNDGPVKGGGWSHAVTRLTEILNCPAALYDAEELDVNVYIADEIDREFANWYEPVAEEPSEPNSKITGLFHKAFQQMRNLKTLSWYSRGQGSNAFEKEFISSNITLPSIVGLRIPEDMSFLVSLCPNIERLDGLGGRSSNDREPNMMSNFIRSAYGAKNLTAFSMGGAWQLKHAEAILETMPNLTKLRIGGSLTTDGNMYSKRTPELFKSFVTILSHLPNLEDLQLPSPTALGLVEREEAWCGNVFYGKSGRDFGRSLWRQYALDIDAVDDIVLSGVTGLKTIEINDYRANVALDDDGQLRVIWPWTDRLTEWSYEEWPDRENEPWEDEYDMAALVDLRGSRQLTDEELYGEDYDRFFGSGMEEVAVDA